MSDAIQQVIAFTGVSEDSARKALDESGGNIIAAVDILSVPPVITGTRYIPKTPTIDDGLTDEVRSKLREARAFADILNASPKNDLRGKAVLPCSPADEDSAKEQILTVPVSRCS